MFGIGFSLGRHPRFRWALGMAGIGTALAYGVSSGALPKIARNLHAHCPCCGGSARPIRKGKGGQKVRWFGF